MSKASKCTSCGGDGFQREYKDNKWVDEIHKDKECNWCFGSGFEVRSSTYIVCPHCGYRHDPNDLEISESCNRFECNDCEKDLDIEVEYSASYSTSKSKVKEVST